MSGPRIPLSDLLMREEDLEAAAEVLREGALVAGERVEAFEEGFARLVGAEHAVATASGTAALELAYLAAGVGPDHEVIVPAITFVATASPVVHAGARPVVAEVLGERNLGIDPSDVEKRFTKRTRAVCAVHYAGYPADVAALRELCDAHGVTLVEDVAHGPLGEAGGRRLGTWGAVGCFSFFSNKVLSIGEGGALVTDDAGVAAAARAHRKSLGLELDELRAALGTSRMGRLEAEIASRRQLTRRYREQLASMDGVVVPYLDEEVERSSCYVMPVLVDAGRRDPLARRLLERHGVQTSVLYPAVNGLSAYVERFGARSLPRSEALASRQLTLPLHPLLSEDDQDAVLEALREELCA